MEQHGVRQAHAAAGVQCETLQCVLQAAYPAIRPNNQKSLLEALTEVHLRRLDTADVLHRRAVATIAIEATPEEVMCPQDPCFVKGCVCLTLGNLDCLATSMTVQGMCDVPPGSRCAFICTGELTWQTSLAASRKTCDCYWLGQLLRHTPLRTFWTACSLCDAISLKEHVLVCRSGRCSQIMRLCRNLCPIWRSVSSFPHQGTCHPGWSG